MLLPPPLPPSPPAPSQIHWNRAARTDKGVSALCQVVSAKLMIEPKDNFADRVNKHLPQQVRGGGACGGGMGGRVNQHLPDGAGGACQGLWGGAGEGEEGVHDGLRGRKGARGAGREG